MFSRTPSGIRNTHLFHSGFYMVIVEGPVDKSFWSNFFPNEVNGYKRKLKSVGGQPEVQLYIDELLSNKAQFVVAIDSDYRLLLNGLHEDTRIVETKYHSIENLMISSSAITSIIRNLSYDEEYEIFIADDWLKHFDETTYSLMIADLIIEKNNLGKKCVGKNCCPFLAKNNNPTFDINKINCFIQKLQLSQKELDEMNEKLVEVKPRFHIRGHFLFSAAWCFITHEVKKIRKQPVTVSNDSLYAMLLSLCELRMETDPILQDIKQQAILAAKKVTNFLSQNPEHENLPKF
jgi:hypothetical protein